MRRCRLLLVSLVAAVLITVSVPPGHAATTREYVALGDSYGAGVGTWVYDIDSTCYRSSLGYAAFVARRYDLSLTLAACSGATTANVLADQVPALRPSTDYVTITAGGNDLGFVSVLSTCALPGWLGDCEAAVTAARRVMTEELPADLAAVYRAISEASPGARIVVTGYPKLFNGEDCNPLTFFSARDEALLNEATVQLNRSMKAAAEAAGLIFVGTAPAFRDHAWCDDRAWVNGPAYPLINSFHPNIRGHLAYADLVGPALVGADEPAAARTDDAPLRVAPVAASAGLARRGMFTFRVPDLTSAATARAAAEAKVTPAELAQLRRAQRDGAPNAVLDRLDAEITARAARRAEAASR